MKVGLILIGDELLSGLRQDKHMAAIIGILQARGLQLGWVRMIGDDWELLVQTLRETLQSAEIVFSFGGIGATPDDLTRQAAAAASGRRLWRHPQAAALIENRFGEGAYPNRIRMSDLPDGCILIPNPVNQIPGFKLGNHHFVPGFPDMAWPMVEWALDTFYQPYFETSPAVEQRWLLREVMESELIPMMEELLTTFPDVRLSSLPSTTTRRQIDFGLKGKAAALEPAAIWFKARMQADKISCEQLP
ncbi:molybdopterin-binding protein [Candidatus Thiothrix sp. Deng01]|uniref:Molybdopterin-binding protein n=1 Tax=Candidatus Thiothrix phosphatis TaxID=3112415 RepID=A0ABU6CRE7_9GAMM|nr:molybdopterin-binding protein [Candidatus Thiothrix sp. Deng01]MEB4589411.1 molybdopterin-binding protein [Candidatus Thiothrix sp. Deng01]